MIENITERPQGITEKPSKAFRLYSGSVLQSYFRHLEKNHNYTVEINPLTLDEEAMTIILRCSNGKSGLIHLNPNGKPIVTCETTSERKIEVDFYDVHYGHFPVMERLMKQMDIPNKGFFEIPKAEVQVAPSV